MRERAIRVCFIALLILITASQFSIVYADNIELKVNATEEFNIIQSDNKYKDAIIYLYENQIINTNDIKSFSSEASRIYLIDTLFKIDRELYNNETVYDTSNSIYTDIINNESVYWAKNNNIMTGYADNTFRPDEKITNEQLAVVLYRYNSYLGNENISVSSKEICLDYNDISDYAKDAVKWAISNKILELSSNKVNPKDYVNKDKMLDIIYKYIELEKEA